MRQRDFLGPDEGKKLYNMQNDIEDRNFMDICIQQILNTSEYNNNQKTGFVRTVVEGGYSKWGMKNPEMMRSLETSLANRLEIFFSLGSEGMHENVNFTSTGIADDFFNNIQIFHSVY